jgi:hypothetical protein
MSIVKKVAASFVFLSLLVGAYYAGRSEGYSKGYDTGFTYHQFSSSSSNAFVTLRNIETFNSRKRAAAMEDLEQRLDTEIIEHWAGIVSMPPDAVIPVRQDEETAKKIMSKVAAYRKKHPTRTTNPAYRSAIESVVARYYDASAEAPQKRPRR